MASAITHSIEKDIVTQVELIAQVDNISILNSNSDEEADWREVIISFLQQDKLPRDLGQAQQIKRRVAHFTLISDNLCKLVFFPLLKCLGPQDVEYVLREKHEGSCRCHIRGGH